MSIGSLNSKNAVLNKNTVNASLDNLHGVEVIDYSTLAFGELNAIPVNSIPVNDRVFFTSIGADVVVAEISQLVGAVIDSTIIATILQDVQLANKIDSFTAIQIEQEVSLTLQQNTIDIVQIVDGPNTFLNKYGWDLDILIDGLPMDKSTIKDGFLTITKESNQNTLCDFDVKVTSPLDFLDFIEGREVVINYITPFSVNRLFTGIVDLPEIDLIQKYITVKCSNRREELIKAKMLPLLPTIGRYSKDVQGEITSVKQEMDYRLETVAQDVDFDSYNTPNINSWYPKVSPDYTITNNNVFYRRPQITWQSRGSVVNDITITMDYNYTRLYHYERNFAWQDSGDPSINATPTFLASNVVWLKDAAASHLTVGVLKSAIKSAGWKEKPNSFQYVDHYTDATFCVQLAFGSPCLNTLNDDVGRTRVRELAPPYAYHTVLYAIPPATEDETRITSAAWSANTRFSQNIKETYTCNVKSTQSINQFGSLTAFMNHSVTDAYDATEWELYKDNSPVPSNSTIVGNDAWSNQTNNIANFNNAILTAIDRAKTQIIGSHRDTRATLELTIQPQLELSHTLSIDTDALSCKGKITKITHKLMLNPVNYSGHTSEIEIALFRSAGVGATTPTEVPSRPIDSPYFDTSTIMFGTRRDQDPDTTPGSDQWNGYVGSINHGFQNPQKTFFVVDTPAIPDELRKQRELEQSATFDVALVNDDLEINF